MSLGRIVVLNGVPRSGKSSIAGAIQARVPGDWVNLGVDSFNRSMPEHLRPGIGLRPGGERPDLEPVIVRLYATLYDAIAAHSRQGFDVVADLGHHDWYSRPLGILPDCARRLTGLPAWIIGVRCPVEIIMERRRADPQGGFYVAGDGVPEPVQRWQNAVHRPGIYDLEVDTSVLTPEVAADRIAERLQSPPTAFTQLAK